MVLSDTPGVVDKPAYKMHQAMNSFVQSTFEDADLILLVTDVLEEYKAGDQLQQMHGGRGYGDKPATIDASGKPSEGAPVKEEDPMDAVRRALESDKDKKP